MREYRFVTNISNEGIPPQGTVPAGDNDYIAKKFLFGYRTLDLSSSAGGLSGQVLGDRSFLIITASTGSVPLKGLIFDGIPEVTIVNTMATPIAVTPGPSVPENGFTEPPLLIAAGKAHKFIRDFNDNRWVAMGGDGGGGGFVNIVTKTASDAITPDQDTVLCTPAAAMTLTLPPAAAKGFHQFIRTDSVEARTVTIQRTGSDQFLTKGGLVTSVTLPYQGAMYKFNYIGANLWFAQLI